MEFLFDPKESIIASEKKSQFLPNRFYCTPTASFTAPTAMEKKALHVLTAGRSEMGLSTTTALDMLSGLFLRSYRHASPLSPNHRLT